MRRVRSSHSFAAHFYVEPRYLGAASQRLPHRGRESSHTFPAASVRVRTTGDVSLVAEADVRSMENVQSKASGTAHLGRVANPLLVGRVADATAQRDRDALDSSIVGLLQEFLDARSVNLYRVDDAGTERRFVSRAVAERDEALPLEDVSQPKGCRKTFRIEERGALVGQLEVLCDAPITARDSVLVRGMLRVLKNQLSLLDYGERDTLTG